MNKPFNGAQLVLANGNPIEDLRFGKGQGLALDAKTGDINASSQKDLIMQIGNLMQAHASGQIVHANQLPAHLQQTHMQSLSASEQADARRQVVTDALADTSGEAWSALGSGLARKIEEQAEREGFLRRIAQGQVLKTGEMPRIPMPPHDAMAVIATSSANVGYQLIRQKVFMPAEFEIVANVRVENLDLEQVNGDLLEDAYNQGLQAIMVQEDRLWKKAADAAVGMVNNLEYIAGELTTKNLGNLRQAVARWNLPATTMIISNDFWADVMGSNDFATMLDPITKYDLVLGGQLSTLVGMNIITDAFRQPNQKVLNPGEVYVVASPEHHAAYTTRGGIRSTPTNGANEGNSTRGWYMSEPFSFSLINARSVAKGKRI